MGYKQEILKKIEALRKYEEFRKTNRREAFKVNNLIKVREDYEHVHEFISNFNANKGGLFKDKETYNKFISDHQDLVKGDRFPRISSGEKGEIEISVYSKGIKAGKYALLSSEGKISIK